MRIIYLGSPAFAVAPLEALVAAGHTIVGVVTQPDRPAGRSRTLSAPPVKQAAQRLGLPVFQPATLRDPAAVASLAELAPDVGIVAAYGEILRKAVLAIPPLGYLNIHPSLLPLHRGPTPVAGAILAGDTETGVTIMKLDAGMDSGPILAQERVLLKPDARTGPLTDELFQLGARMLVDVLPEYAAGRRKPQPQDDSRATVTRLLRKADGLIDWNQPADLIERQVRAYDPWPGTYTLWQGQNLKIRAVSLANVDAPFAAGTLVTSAGRPLVTTGAGALELQAVQPAGKRPQSGTEWLRGQRITSGQQLG